MLDNPEYKVKVTVESKSGEYLDRAVTSLLENLPESAILRIEEG